MNDRFKFRVWREEEKRFVESVCGSPLVISQDGSLCDSYDYLGYDGFGIVEQCTGLKDKNGKLIYEGDLIKEPANKYPLEIYYDKGAWLTREYRKNGNNEQLLYVLINCYGVEAIGNIHENADLLGEE